MKYLKLMVLVLVTMFTFGSAKAQVVVRAHIGGPDYMWHGHHYHHRRPYWKNHHRYYRYY
jgi:hypothetical protein